MSVQFLPLIRRFVFSIKRQTITNVHLEWQLQNDIDHGILQSPKKKKKKRNRKNRVLPKPREVHQSDRVRVESEGAKTHFVRGHLADGAMGLHSVKLLQAPVELLQGVAGLRDEFLRTGDHAAIACVVRVCVHCRTRRRPSRGRRRIPVKKSSRLIATRLTKLRHATRD